MNEPIKEYDEKGNLIHYKSPYGYEWWKEYDERGNETHFKDSNGFKYWTEYDESGTQTHYKSSYGYEFWTEYDKDGKDKCSLVINSIGEISTENENLFSDKLKRKYNLLLLRRKK